MYLQNIDGANKKVYFICASLISNMLEYGAVLQAGVKKNTHIIEKSVGFNCWHTGPIV